MAAITKAVAEAKLAEWLAAESAVARNQSYSIEGRSMTRADATEITKKIDYWSAKVRRLSSGRGGGIRVRRGVPSP